MISELHYLIVKNVAGDDVIKIGKALLDFGFDDTTDGFWVLDMHSGIEYYSPKFIRSIGYTAEEFPPVPESWQGAIFEEDLKQAVEDYYKHEADPAHPYYVTVRYRHKEGKTVKLICAGTIVNRGGEKPIMLGTHEIISIE